MIAVIFEARPHADGKQAYLDAAERLRPLLAGIDGFISIERFESLGEPGKIFRCLLAREDACVGGAMVGHRRIQRGAAVVFATIDCALRSYATTETSASRRLRTRGWRAAPERTTFGRVEPSRPKSVGRIAEQETECCPN
jgi:hypothetical protein